MFTLICLSNVLAWKLVHSSGNGRWTHSGDSQPSRGKGNGKSWNNSWDRGTQLPGPLQPSWITKQKRQSLTQALDPRKGPRSHSSQGPVAGKAHRSLRPCTPLPDPRKHLPQIAQRGVTWHYRPLEGAVHQSLWVSFRAHLPLQCASVISQN